MYETGCGGVEVALEHPDFKVFPNPFSSSTRFAFNAPAADRVSLGVFDVEGRLVNSFSNLELREGLGDLLWNGTSSDGTAVPPGVYFVRIEVSGRAASHKVVRR
jgi:flagellar hook assembly protein FlgD